MNSSKELAAIKEQVESLESKVNQFESTLIQAESDAQRKGLEIGMTAKVQDFDGKTIVLFAPPEVHDSIIDSLRSLRRSLNCKFVVLSDVIDLKELGEIDLKAIGLKRLEE